MSFIKRPHRDSNSVPFGDIIPSMETTLSALRGGYILTEENYRILWLNERTSSIFLLARLDARQMGKMTDRGG